MIGIWPDTTAVGRVGTHTPVFALRHPDAVSARVCTELVERPVLLHDHDHVLDLVDPRHGYDRRARGRARGRARPRWSTRRATDRGDRHHDRDDSDGPGRGRTHPEHATCRDPADKARGARHRDDEVAGDPPEVNRGRAALPREDAVASRAARQVASSDAVRTIAATTRIVRMGRRNGNGCANPPFAESRQTSSSALMVPMIVASIAMVAVSTWRARLRVFVGNPKARRIEICRRRSRTGRPSGSRYRRGLPRGRSRCNRTRCRGTAAASTDSHGQACGRIGRRCHSRGGFRRSPPQAHHR